MRSKPRCLLIDCCRDCVNYKELVLNLNGEKVRMIRCLDLNKDIDPDSIDPDCKLPKLEEVT